jgi:hypothetical protein
MNKIRNFDLIIHFGAQSPAGADVGKGEQNDDTAIRPGGTRGEPNYRPRRGQRKVVAGGRVTGAKSF